MKTSSAGKHPDRAAGCGWLMANLLVLPGLGTCLAGEKLRGAIQMLCALAGFSLTLYWLVSNALLIWETRVFILQGGFPPRAGLAGMSLFFCAWFWSLASAWRLMRRSKQRDNEN